MWHILLYFFMIKTHLIFLRLSDYIAWLQILEWLVNNELENLSKQAILVSTRRYPWICLEEQRKARKYQSEYVVSQATFQRDTSGILIRIITA
jgi:hypothetical protein